MITQDPEEIRPQQIKIQTLQVQLVKEVVSDKLQAHNLLMPLVAVEDKQVLEMVKQLAQDKELVMPQPVETMLQVMLAVQEVELLMLKIIITEEDQVDQENNLLSVQWKNLK